MDPLVSVIVPVYNVAPFLREALDSLVNQTYRNLEIWLVDDGSTDGSGGICDNYAKDARVRVIHQENRGLSGARNSGLEALTGEYVAFLDPDDCFYPEMIQRMMDAIRQDRVDMAVCGYMSCQANGPLSEGKLLFRHSVPDTILFSKESLNWLILNRINYSVWNKVYTRKLWGTIRFPESMNFEDIHVMYRILEKAERVRLLSDKLYIHRKHPGSITQTFSSKNIRDKQLALRLMEEYVTVHTPGIFTEENKKWFYCGNLRAMELMCMEWNPRSPQEKEQRTNLRAELLAKANTISPITGIKNNVVHWMFRYAPGLLPKARECYRAIKSLKYRIKKP